MDEQDRIQQTYDKKNRAVNWARYSYFYDGNMAMYQQRERVLLRMLRYVFGGVVSDKKVLDIGCGDGGTLLPLISYGFSPQNCYGVDILPSRIENARRKFPTFHFECCSAENSSFEKGSFDLVTMFTCLGSILDTSIRQKVCEASINFLKPGGWVLVYDFVFNNPSNPDVKAVRLNELDGYFRGFRRYSKKLTLLPPLARILGRYSYGLCSMCSWIPFLQTHRMTLFQKPE